MQGPDSWRESEGGTDLEVSLRRRTPVARFGSRFGLAIVVAIAAVGFSVPVGNASLLGLNNNCGPTSQPFAQFGDYRNYTFGTNGGLESGATGWVLAGASV